MRTIVASLLIATTGLTGVVAHAEDTATPAAAPAAKPAYTTADTPLGDLLDNPATKAILVKYLPDLVGNDQINMARGMTLKSLQGYAADMVTDEKLAEIDAELAKVPAAK